MIQKRSKSALFVFLLIVLFSLILNKEIADVQAQNSPVPLPSHPQAAPQSPAPKQDNKKPEAQKKSDDDDYSYFILRVPKKVAPTTPPEPGTQEWFNQLPPDPCVGTAASITRFCQQRVSSLI